MTTSEKIQAIKEAIEKANNHLSKMDEISWSVPALSSLKIRHLMNNLGAISTNYLECGVHVGGLFSSTVRNNPNLLTAIANDSFESDATNGDPVEPRFYENANKCLCPETRFAMLKGDTFSFIPADYQNVDLYLFDADHSYESQRKAMTHFLPAMADEFIVCVDDYDWREVWEGTIQGISEANVEILFQQGFQGNDHDNDGWWNGFYIALLKKK